MIKGAIFDLDGTLLDSMSIWDTIGRDYLRSLGIEPKENLAETFKTFTLEQSAEYYRTHYGVTLSVDEIIYGVNGMIEDFYRDTVPLKKGAAKFLESLFRSGVKMCIATVTNKHLVEAVFECTELFHGDFHDSRDRMRKGQPTDLSHGPCPSRNRKGRNACV